MCTIHQPSTYIFQNFDSLLLLQRGGQTVFFGELGQDFSNLIKHFESAPGVEAFPGNKNPATWMLEVTGAGTGKAHAQSSITVETVDFHVYYKSTALSAVNATKVESLCTSIDSIEGESMKRVQSSFAAFGSKWFHDSEQQHVDAYLTPSSVQFWQILCRTSGNIY